MVRDLLAYVKSASIENRTARDMYRINLATQTNRDQNGDFRARVVAVNIGRWIRLGITELLRLFQRIGK